MQTIGHVHFTTRNGLPLYDVKTVRRVLRRLVGRKTTNEKCKNIEMERRLGGRKRVVKGS
jgi:hypothetical protein